MAHAVGLTKTLKYSCASVWRLYCFKWMVSWCFENVVGIERVVFPDRSSRQATRAAWRQSQCVASGTSGGQRAISALSGSVSSSSSLSSLGPTRPCAAGPITADTSKYLNIYATCTALYTMFRIFVFFSR